MWPAPGMRRHGPAHNLYAMSRRLAEKDSTTVAAQIGGKPMSPAVVGVDEVVGVDDCDAGDELVLDEEEGGGLAAQLG